MRKVICWIVFVYRCNNGKPQILLLSKDGEKWEPIFHESDSAKGMREYVSQLMSTKEKDYHPDRFLSWWHSLSVGEGEEVLYKISVSVARIKEGVVIRTPKGYKEAAWIEKESVPEMLKHWKGYSRAFKKAFPEDDTFWECLND